MGYGHGMRILMGGAQRSGTSLLRSIVGSHSSVAFFPYDLTLWTRYRAQWAGQDCADPASQRELVAAILADEKVVIAEDVPTEAQVLRALRNSGGVPAQTESVFDAFLSAYATKRGRPIWGLKTPWNEFHAKEILDFYDDAVFIHLIRDPRESALSAMYADGGSWFYDPALHISRWKKSAQLAERNSVLFGDRYHVVKYEDLAHDPEGTITRLLPFLGLDYEAGIENGDRQPGWDGSNSSFSSQTAKKSGSRPVLPAGLQWLYSQRLATELEVFGYPASDPTPFVQALGRPLGLLRLAGVFFIHRGIAAKRFLVRIRASASQPQKN
jgi:hypothetical protein